MTKDKELIYTKDPQWVPLPPELQRRRRKRLARLLVLTPVLLILAAGALLLLNRFSARIILRGEASVTVECGDTYEDAGADARLIGILFHRSGVPLTMWTENGVDIQHLGTYTVSYGTQFWWMEARAERTVTVVDTRAPEILLTTDPEHYTVPGDPYEEEGFTARDNYDGDLTAQVIRTEQDGAVTYSVTDSSGNRTEVRRQIVYHDPIPPVLTLEGGTEITMTAGTAYEEPGITACDNCDGDLTDRVQVTGEVNIYLAGTYRLQYQVTDSYGNEVRAERMVIVKPVPKPEKPKPAPAEPEGGVIYLTFDDGPGSHTNRLLGVLAKYGVKATFFVVDNGNYDTLRRIAAEGHSIGIHSASHNYERIYASEEAYFQDLNTVRQMILTETGVDTTLVRFPGGSSNTVSRFNPGIMTRLTQALTDNGYQYFDWNVDSNDAGGAASAREVFENVTAACSRKKVSVVLQHDIKGFSVDAVEQIILWGLENGYTFLPLDSTSPTVHHGVNN